MPRRAAVSSGGSRDPNLFRPERYRVEPIKDHEHLDEYRDFLKAHYDPLGFDASAFAPGADSRPYQIRYLGELAAIFRLTEIRQHDSVYYQLVPGAIAADQQRRRLLEVNNVVIARRFRASAVLGLLLYNSARLAHEGGFDFVVGLNRFQILRHFVDFGVIPAEHPPVHVLGKSHIQDFVNYYDTAEPASIDYMHERAQRYFRQEYIMCRLRQQYVLPARKAGAGPVAASTSQHVDQPIRAAG